MSVLVKNLRKVAPYAISVAGLMPAVLGAVPVAQVGNLVSVAAHDALDATIDKSAGSPIWPVTQSATSYTLEIAPQLAADDDRIDPHSADTLRDDLSDLALDDFSRWQEASEYDVMTSGIPEVGVEPSDSETWWL